MWAYGSVLGGVAQLAERFGRIEEVVGSIPIASTSALQVGHDGGAHDSCFIGQLRRNQSSASGEQR